VAVGVCIRVLGCESRGWDEISGGPKESRWTKFWHVCIHLCVQSTHLCVYEEKPAKMAEM